MVLSLTVLVVEPFYLRYRDGKNTQGRGQI